MAFSTRERVASRTLGSWLTTRETVLIETPASSATSSMVALVMGSLPAFARIRRAAGGQPSVVPDSVIRTQQQVARQVERQAADVPAAPDDLAAEIRRQRQRGQRVRRAVVAHDRHRRRA